MAHSVSLANGHIVPQCADFLQIIKITRAVYLLFFKRYLSFY